MGNFNHYVIAFRNTRRFRKVKRRWAIAGVVTVGAAVFSVFAQGPKLQMYTSPSLTYQGKPARLTVLTPAGWKVLTADRLIGSSFPKDAWEVCICPPNRFGWIPPAIRDLLDIEPHPYDQLVVRFMAERPTQRALETTSFGETSGPGGNQFWAIRSLPEYGATAHYSQHDRRYFDSTFREICESFQVAER
jgi:hypothetical protein